MDDLIRGMEETPILALIAIILLFVFLIRALLRIETRIANQRTIIANQQIIIRLLSKMTNATAADLISEFKGVLIQYPVKTEQPEADEKET